MGGRHLRHDPEHHRQRDQGRGAEERDALLALLGQLLRPNDCVIGGEQALILRTTDGGKTWEKVDAPKGVSENLLAMSRGKDRNQIWAVGPEATIIHSTDGGKTWEDQSLHKDEALNGVAFLDDKNGWVQGEFGVIKHTLGRGEDLGRG